MRRAGPEPRQPASWMRDVASQSPQAGARIYVRRLSETAAERDNLRTLTKAPHSGSPRVAHTRHAVLLTFAIDGDLRFISHRDTVRMMTRALARAGLPVAYSQGFNPHVRMALLLPRPVGLATDGDLAVVHLSNPHDPNHIASRLRAQLPEDALLLGVQSLENCRQPALTSVTYELELGAEASVDLPSLIRNFLDSNSVVVQRQDRLGQKKPPLDIRPLVQEIKFENDTLTFLTRFVDDRTATPRDVLSVLSLPWEDLRHRMRRRNIGWQ